MKILQVCADSGIAPDGTKGASIHLRSLAAAFARAGHDVVTFTARPPEGSGETFPAPLRRLATGHELVEEGGIDRPDMVYERYSLGHLGGLEGARAMGCPFVLEVNAPLVEEATAHRARTIRESHRAAEERLFRQADLVVAVSEPLRQYVAQSRGMDEGTLTVRNGCDPKMYPEHASLEANPRATIVFLGHPKPWHGADALPGLLAELVARGLDARLLVIGGGPGAEEIREGVSWLGCLDRLEITGPVSPAEAARRLRESTVAIAPYPKHPFFYFCPLKVVECMAAGLPVVSTPQGDIPVILGDTGALVPAGDPLVLADAVAWLVTDPHRRRDLGRRARERAVSRFTWDRAAGHIVEAVLAIEAEPAMSG